MALFYVQRHSGHTRIHTKPKTNRGNSEQPSVPSNPNGWSHLISKKKNQKLIPKIRFPAEISKTLERDNMQGSREGENFCFPHCPQALSPGGSDAFNL